MRHLRKEGACYHRGRYKDLYDKTSLPTPPKQGEGCDECPFAATL
ncbi:hypothetical protein ACIRPT_24520 [Streptomyces sp. NPDC101227]